MNAHSNSIEIRPTWIGNTEILLAALEAGTFEGKRQARAEIRRMARLLDELHAVDAGNHAPVAVKIKYQVEDAYLAGALHVAKGWRWWWEATSPNGEALASVVRGSFPSYASMIASAIAQGAKLEDREAPRQARISDLVKRKAELIDERVQTAGHGRRARIQEQIDAIAAELEILSN